MDSYSVEQIMNTGKFSEVYEELDDAWRHGNYTHRVYENLQDGSFWAINGQESGDGEFREYEAPFRVFRKEVKSFIYTEKE